MSRGYYSDPSIHDNSVIFISESDLWSYRMGSERAERLTAGFGSIIRPHFSPDGTQIAYASQEEGNFEVYTIASNGGSAKRLTFLGATTVPLRWKSNNELVLASDRESPFRGQFLLYALNLNTGKTTSFNWGAVSDVTFEPEGKGTVLERNGRLLFDPSWWKRYRGGTAGDLWIDRDGDGNFKRLLGLKGNLANPIWIQDRIYFIADHEGYGNIYSCTPTGKNVTRHTDHRDFYVRNLNSDNINIVYHCGADIHCFSPKTNQSIKLDFEYPSSRTHRNRKFPNPVEFLESASLSPDGKRVISVSRGRVFEMENWHGAVTQVDYQKEGRNRLAKYLHDGIRAICTSDISGEESIEIYNLKTTKRIKHILNQKQLGRPLRIVPSPTSDLLAISNHRSELLILDLKTSKIRVLDKSDSSNIKGFSFSPDGNWLAYGFSNTQQTTVIKIANVKSGKIEQATKPVLHDFDPVFDPNGKYLYFLSSRTLNPIYDSLQFELGFNKGVKPYLITLQNGTPNPFHPNPKIEKYESKTKDKKKTPDKKFDIDFNGIENRIIEFPVPESKYYQIGATEDKCWYLSAEPEGSLDEDFDYSSESTELFCYDLTKQKEDVFASGIWGFEISNNKKKILLRKDGEVKVISTSNKPEEPQGQKRYSPDSGHINFNRLQYSVSPVEEWRQMFKEAWRLQRDHFWTPDMSKIDWQNVFERYYPIIDRVSTRKEFSDLVWEMQGELGTSHAYEMGGDHRSEPSYSVGKLGISTIFDKKSCGFRITQIFEGDPWDRFSTSPLNTPGVEAKVGEIITHIQGKAISANESVNLGHYLINLAGRDVQLVLLDPKTKRRRDVLVKTLGNERALRYREWVERNREYVHHKTGGKVGYVHVPNMGPQGFSEFHRYFLAEVYRKGLIIDVRYNGGGHVSGLLLEKLSRKRIGYCESRWWGKEPYPNESPMGPMVALTNEFAGSDGDIFSHSFKLMNLGPLIGKRTWGGVIGIWPRHSLVDGTMTTQPEFSFWFKDVGWGVENFGTDPTIEVEYRPQDYRNRIDPQLDRGIEEAEKIIKKHKSDLIELNTEKPDLSPPEFPI